MVVMKTKKLLLFGLIIVLISSCKNYLDPWPNGNYDSETIWQYQSMVQGLINRCYDNIEESSVGGSDRNYNNNEGAYLDGATDDAVLTSVTNVMRRYAVNSMTTSQDPFQTYWDRDYRSIAQCNIFLKDRRGYNTRYMVKPLYNQQVRNRLQGEAFALRAWFEWDLLKKFGGKGTDGNLLGFPIVTEPIPVEEGINIARGTYDDCVKQIIADCDSAIKYLPLAYRDFLYTSLPAPYNDLAYQGGRYWGRFDQVAVWGIKANVYLFWASPRFNPDNVVARWDSCAKWSQKIVNFKLTVDQIASTNSFRPTDAVSFTNPNSPEIVFTTRYNTGNTVMERMFYPGNFQGNGEIGATQELVNSFGMANGYPISDASYDPANPYVGRDTRFYSVVFYNNSIAKRQTGGTTMYTFQNWNEGVAGAGKDAANTRSDNSKTNYHIKKYVYMDLNWADASVKSAPHSKFVMRWAHFLLNYAEAANHVTGNPNTALYGSLTPVQAIKYLRARKSYDGVLNTFNVTDNYLTAVAAGTGTETFDDLVKRERRIETCFEGIRFYDLRRWTTGDKPGEGNWEASINTTVHGAYINQTVVSPAAFTYNLNWAVEDRSFPSPYNPIPYNEMMRMSKLVQNQGWDSWN
jgi:starch-binding outer membrane protein, SusD/RagB family